MERLKSSLLKLTEADSRPYFRMAGKELPFKDDRYETDITQGGSYPLPLTSWTGHQPLRASENLCRIVIKC